jgi:hypothetical protein
MRPPKFVHFPQTAYKIPNYDTGLKKWRYIWLILPVSPVAFGILGYLPDHSVNSTVVSALMGFFVGIPLTIVLFFVLFLTVGRKVSRLERAKWAKHDFAWYRDSFPEHVRESGQIICRHCGGRNTRVTNMMQRTFTRVHACGTCGETLYFSAEKL